MPLALLLTTAAATAVGAAVLHAVRGLRKQLTELTAASARSHVATGHAAAVPAARETPSSESWTSESWSSEIRAAVGEALAEERERELAEARAFWAAQESRDAADAPSLLGGLAGLGDDAAFFVPRQADFAGFEPGFDAILDSVLDEGDDTAASVQELAGEFPEDSPELAAARRRHPSYPGKHDEHTVPVQTPVVADHERTVTRLEELAEARTALSDVRPGPLGTLDVYVFADGTTLCMTPGHRETAERLAESLREGEAPVLLGGSGVAGAYALTFSCGQESVYILADRVIASL
ncbi:hypothetical protein [Streptomyces sp. NPDC050738]|uniref:hypothetical protein n=1 Tax=Streptomyces sp. NPDC050738 TaxID=3154744 RepID=UPI0034133AF9